MNREEGTSVPRVIVLVDLWRRAPIYQIYTWPAVFSDLTEIVMFHIRSKAISATPSTKVHVKVVELSAIHSI